MIIFASLFRINERIEITQLNKINMKHIFAILTIFFTSGILFAQNNENSPLTPCQPFEVHLNQNLLSHPLGDDNTMKTCSGEVVTLAGEATFPNNNQNYNQTQSGTLFIWHFGNENYDTSAVIHKTYFQAKGINFSLFAIDVNGCHSSNVVKGKIVNSSSPIQSINPVIDLLPNETIVLNGSNIDQSATLIYNPIQISEPIIDNTFYYYDTVLLPDGNNISYNSNIQIQSFLPNQTIQNVNQIGGIRMSIEHSHLGDLSFRITCPNGSSTLLKAFNPASAILSGAIINPCSSNGGNNQLGVAIDVSTSSTCYNQAGVGWDYEFRPGASHCFGAGASTTAYNYTDPCQNSLSGPTLMPSYNNSFLNNPEATVFYGSYETWENLIGCPMNGNWMLTVMDHFAVDNGYIFNWGITLTDSLTPAQWNYNINVDSVLFIGENIEQIDPFTATVSLPNTGNYPYSVKVIDEFGCNYNANIMINCVLSVEDIDAQGTINLYPNPAQNFVQVAIVDPQWNNSLIEIYDASGKLMEKNSIPSDRTQLDFSSFTSGIYYVKFINSDRQIKSIKILKIN